MRAYLRITFSTISIWFFTALIFISTRAILLQAGGTLDKTLRPRFEKPHIRWDEQSLVRSRETLQCTMATTIPFCSSLLQKKIL